jgi:hypothetical protein
LWSELPRFPNLTAWMTEKRVKKMKNHVSKIETWEKNKILTMSWGKTKLLFIFYHWEHEKKKDSQTFCGCET